jgi:hypothetical protein
MKKYLILLIITFTCSGFALKNDKILLLKKTSTTIHVDGVIDPVWNSADSVSDFVQFQPYYGKEPSRKTIAKVVTTDEALYCLIVCYDERKNIQNNTGKLDEFTGDIVSIMLDTFGDKRTAYKFAVAASGVRSDCRLLDDARNRDYNWDGIWFADSKVYDWGFVVEMEIPYKSIQYDEKLTDWGLDFDRWIPINSEDIYWCAYEENEGQRISKFGKLMFDDFKPTVRGLNLEVYPVGISKATYLRDKKYKVEPDAGIDIFYNPSQKLTFQLTANPDFAQIEADPFDFNISRYESYFDERRPFFTEGNEIFMASGRDRNSGFYRPLELFYSRRIGKKLPDGSEVPLLLGTKAFGRIEDWEYGGFVALADGKDYVLDTTKYTEDRAYFGSVRIKKQILDNSSIGLLYVGKHTKDNSNGVIDIDGAFRGSSWQLAYQLARSFNNSDGDYAMSSGFRMSSENWLTAIRTKYIGEKFDINQVGYVPWKGTAEFTLLTGPRWYYDEGYLKAFLIYFGGILYNEKVDGYTDHGGLLGFNMNFRNNWGYELTFNYGRSKDGGKKFSSYEINLSSWFNVSPKWSGNIWGGYTKTYNFSRDYPAFYSWVGSEFNWRALDILQIGTSANMFIEGNPVNKIEDVTYNARPYFSITPINDLNVRVYFDNLFVRSQDQMQRVIVGFLFAYNFLPKSWIYLAVNEIQDRSERYDPLGNLLPNKMHTKARAGVLKLKYLYYF